MKILLAASEVHPFAKTGGLADVAGALPRALDRQGLDVAVCLPLYPKVRRRNDPMELVADRVACPFGGEDRPFRLWQTPMPGSPDVPVYLVENQWMFEAEEAFYGVEPGSYGDAHLRFLYFARAILRVPEAAEFYPDIFHLNDWQTALVAPLLRTVHRHDPELNKAACVTTIHNLAYQGAFPIDELQRAGIPDWLLREGRLLEGGLGNLLAGGVRFSDAITTVSRTYAQEILHEENGNRLDPLLRWRSDLLEGIVNGLDVEVWNPEIDPHLDHHYTAEDLKGKAECKKQLLRESGLAPTDGPVFGVVSRLAAQKGLKVVVPVMHHVLTERRDARFVLLGSGEPSLEQAFQQLAHAHPESAAANLKFDPRFASLVEAGADLFLMPSEFEPCGLNQLISMQYGTPPIVHAVGGLEDTVTDTTEATLKDGTATGFKFRGLSPENLLATVKRALDLYDQPDRFRKVQRRGMIIDWSWNRPAATYEELYERALERRANPRHLDYVLDDLPPDPIEVHLPSIPHIPEGYARDVMVMTPFSPTTLFINWELGGANSTSLIDGMPQEEKDRVRYELIIRDDLGRESRHEVGGVGHQWFATVEPERSYSGALFLIAPGRAPVQVLDTPPVTMPPDVSPEL